MLEPYYADDMVSVHVGDCRKVLPLVLADDSVDAVVCDPPYELGFMGRGWDASGVAFDPVTWRECLRVLKPGGYLAAFGGTRTWHRLMVAIEDAGFEIRDTVAELTGHDAPGLIWTYGEGFPKSLNVGRSIDMHLCTLPGRHYANQIPKQPRPDDHVCPLTERGNPWRGRGTAQKPAWEPIVVARKPLAGTVAANVLEYGTGALNIDGCRVEGGTGDGHWHNQRSRNEVFNSQASGGQTEQHAAGRWPTNLIFGHSASCVEDGPCEPDCPVAELDRQSAGKRASKPSKSGSAGADRDGVYGGGKGLPRDYTPISRDDQGGASRFFPTFRYEAKAPASERPKLDDGTAHSTVKPLDLVRWLVRLITPPGGVVLDPFAGSGTTGEACVLEGFHSVLIELEQPHAELIKQRLRKPLQSTLFNEVTP